MDRFNGYQPVGNYALKNETIAKSLTSAKGDMIYASAASTPARLGIGSNGQFLSVANGIPTWVNNPNTDTHYTNYLQIKGNGTEAVKFTQDSNKTLNLKPGNNVSISAASGEITINATDTHNSHIVYSGKKSDGATDISSGTASSGNITLGDSGVTAGAYGDTTAQTPGYGSTFKVPSISVNAKGIVTAIGEHTVKIPASDNTDTKNTAGSMDSAEKLYLVGAKSQAANPQTYSNSQVYMTDGTLAAPALSTRNIVLPESSLGLKFVDGDNVASAADFHYTSIGGAYLDIAGHLFLTEAGPHPDKPENKTELNYMSYADYFDTGIAVVGKRASSDLPSIIRLSFPEKNGTIALTSDLSTLLDKGTSSTAVNQVVYNPVEMKKNLTVPSLSGEKTTIAGNSISTFGLGGTKDGSTAMSDLTLVGFSGTSSIDNVYTTHIQQLSTGPFQITYTHGKNLVGTLTFDGSWWRMNSYDVLTEENCKFQQWKLTSTDGAVITFNICTKK